MNAPIVFVSGSKGGVGKSITTMAVLDYLATENRYVKLLEADTSNPTSGTLMDSRWNANPWTSTRSMAGFSW